MRLPYWIIAALIMLLITCGCASLGNDVIIGQYVSLKTSGGNWIIAQFYPNGTFFFGPSPNNEDLNLAFNGPLPTSGTWTRPDEAEIRVDWNDGRTQLIPYGSKNQGFADSAGWHDREIVVQGVTLRKIS